MTWGWQDVAALALVIAAVLYLGRGVWGRVFRKRNAGGCGGCPLHRGSRGGCGQPISIAPLSKKTIPQGG